MHRYILFILSLLLAFPFCRADERRTDYRSYRNIGLGAEASVISCFLQDTQGLVWVGSNKGLFSYDGYSAQAHFTFGEHNNTRIYCGAVIDSTYLYLGADNGLLIYNYRTDTYLDTGIGFPTDIRTMVVCNDTVWLGTLNGLYTYHPATRTLSALHGDALPHQTIYSLIHASDGCLYIGTYNGCCRYAPATGRFEAIDLPVSRGRSNLFVNSLLDDPARGCLWIGTEGCLFRYSFADGQTRRIDDFRNNSVKSLALDGYGQLLVGTDNGLYIYADDRPLQHIIHDARNPQSLANNIIWTIFTDRQHNVWLGTDYGISMTRHRAALHYVPISQITGTGEGNQFYSMLRDRQGNFWFGGTNGLIRFALPSGNAANAQATDVAWYKMGDRAYPLSHNRVRQLYEDREGTLWVATDGSISRYDADRRQFVSYSIVDSTGRYNANWAYSLFEDGNGQLWIATCLGGVFVVDKHRLMQATEVPYRAEKTYSIDNGLSGMFINQMTTDREGNVWALLYNSPHSIEKIDPRTGRVTHVDAGQLQGERTPNFILSATDGALWIGFPGGVMRMNPADGSNRLLPFDAYTHNEVLSMAEADGRIWISTTDGFWVADGKAEGVRRLNVTDKRFTGLYFDPSADALYLGTVDGFAISSPDALLPEVEDHPLLLTALYVNNQLYQPDSLRPMSGIRYADRIELAHDQNNLVFELSDLPYSVEEKSKLIYRLTEVDKDWNWLLPDDNRIVYNNLGYGTYRLLVGKLDAYGHPSGHPYALDICIRPPWYYTGWARGAYVLLFLALVVWTVNFFRVKNRLKLARLEKEKILEQSRAKMEFFTNLSHDLKAPLSLIIAPISRLLPGVRNPQVKEQLAQVQRNAMKLNSLIHTGLDFNRVDSGQNTLLILSQIELVGFARDLLTLYAEGKKLEGTLHFDFRANREKIYVQMDAIKLESILDNLLSNAVKYTPAGGTITLDISLPAGSREVEITLSDTGMGIAEQDRPYIFQRFYQSARTAGTKEGTGIGLYLVKTYTELHGGSVSLESAENQGTTITLHLPVAEAVVSEESPEVTPEIVPPADDAPKILIVDDNADVVEFVCQVLHARYLCHVARNGKEGLERAMTLLPDLIISDILMPVMDGLEMVRRLKKHVPTSTIPLILLTGKSDKETELESIRLHIDAFIAKPFEPDILLSRVEQLLSVSRTHEAKARMEVLATPTEIEAVSYDEKFLETVTHLIEEHIADADLNVNALCEWASTNNKQMYRKLKQLTGLTPVEYIKSIRMKKAAMLLKQQKFSVAEVMYMVGFSNHSYFSKCFQAAFGMTPKQYG